LAGNLRSIRHAGACRHPCPTCPWIPAFAGMTNNRLVRGPLDRTVIDPRLTLTQTPAFCPTPGLSDKQRAIIEAAARTFLAAGYREASMDAIAREAGVSKQTTYNHYGNKEALFSDVITQHCQDVLLSRLEA